MIVAEGNNQVSTSVIIPLYNAEMSIDKCIESALHQTLPPFEIIVIDDGSTDSSAKIVENYKHKVILISQENQGQGAARNTGLRVATGKYIAFLDADDYWLPDFLKTCVGFLEDHQEAIAVSTGFLAKQIKGEYKGPSNIEELAQKYPKGIIIPNFYDFWAKYDHVRTGTVVIRKDVIEIAGYQRADLRISQDLEFWGYIATFGLWGFIPKVLWHGDSCSVALESGWREKYRVRRKLCSTVEKWEKRIWPRLKADEQEFFKIVRGRVAASFSHNMILSGRKDEAYETYRIYSSSLPNNNVTRIMKFGASFGKLGWWLVSVIFNLRETLKNVRLIN